MSTWHNHALSNEWIPLTAATPDAWQRVQVWFHSASRWAIWNSVVRVFVSEDGHVLHGVTHWRKRPAQTDGLLDRPRHGAGDQPAHDDPARRAGDVTDGTNDG